MKWGLAIPDRHFSRSGWIGRGLSLLVVMIVAYGLLRAVETYQALAERQVVDLSLRNMRSGMRLAMAEAMLSGRTAEIGSWAGGNPVRWLAGEMPNFQGECRLEWASPEPGSWCFDSTRRELVYRPRHGDYVDVTPDVVSGHKLLRWKVVKTVNAVAPDGLVGLNVESTVPYRWHVGRD